jgi:hypothetical protein
LATADEAGFRKYPGMFSNRVLPPEFEQYYSGDTLMRNPVHSIDAWFFGVFIHMVYLKKPELRSEDIASRGNIPQSLYKFMRNILQAKPENRMDFDSFIKKSCIKGGFFDDKLLDTSNFLENFALQDKGAKENFLLYAAH